MRRTIWLGLVAAAVIPLLSAFGQTPEEPAPGEAQPPQAAAPVNLSPSAAEVVRLAGSGVGDEVVLAYVQNSQAVFNLSADDVLYLKDIGISSQVTSAMLSHDSTLHGQAQQYAPAPSAPAPAPAVAPQVAPTAPAPPPTYEQAPAAPPTYVSSAPPDVGYFYNDLAPYGTWVSLEGYGWCWQPRTVVVSRGWRPYCNGGHWVYTDAGWYWQSDYSWGWAPFHYGRWQMHPRCGWVWSPDRVWGPAWVTWRVAGDNCGWAPLPPHADFDVHLGWRYNGVSVGASFGFGLGVGAFAFVSLGDFCNHDLGRRCLPPARVTTIYHQTTIINNYEVHNNTVVHRGIPVERVSAVSHVPVPRATVRDVPASSARGPGRTQSVVYRAQLQAPARPVQMAAQKVDDRHPVIQHAPIAPVRTVNNPTATRSGSAPATAPRQPNGQAPTTSTWSSGTKPSTTTHGQPAPRTAPSTPAPAAPASPWSSTTKAPAATQPQPAPRVPGAPATPTTPKAPPQTQPATRAPQASPALATPKGSPAPGATRAPSSPQYQPAPRNSQPAPATQSPKANPGSSSAAPAAAPQSQPVARSAQPAPVASPAPAPSRAPDDWKQGLHPAPSYHGTPTPAQTQPPMQNPHAYTPKSAHQAAEIHASPSSPQSQSGSAGSQGRGQGSKSGKND